ncbi:putative G-protein coupled receptor 179 [Tenrec ecaudatus]|uniref:putative G-protein coupled receptor 179 n=1 Tax=Tenrec ecaudatus TaxID=94439 RepID=UPI003F59032D
MGTGAGLMPPPLWALLGCCILCGWTLGGPWTRHSLPPMSSQAQPGSVPLWAPPEGAEAALAFLYSGDSQQLLGANCSERYEALGAEAKAGLPPTLQRAAGTVSQAANFLNMLLQANDIRESSVGEDVEWYQALVRSVAEGDPRAYRAMLTFSPPPGASHLQLALQATRMGEETILRDLSEARGQEEHQAEDLDSPALQKRVLTNDLRSLHSPKWAQGDGYVGDMQHVRLSPPFLECQQGHLRPGWLITLSATFYGLKPDLGPEVRGQVQMDLELQSMDINQCAGGPGWYANTHLCDLNSTQCVPLERQGFVLGRYLCRCRPGFYGASRSGGLGEPTGQFGSLQGSSGRLLWCQPCPEGCTSCMDATPCLVEEALALRAAVLACQACCMVAIFLSMLLSYRCRRRRRRGKSIRSPGLVLLETILLGALLLYFPVFILYFKASVFRCIALRWVRLLGFLVVYGSIVLKLQRVLQLFVSRTAPRGPHLSGGWLLRRLGLLLLLALSFLVVWTAGVLERGVQHTPLVTRGYTRAGRHFDFCHHSLWDYIMVVAEILLLCWGSFLCYTSRTVPSAFHEPRYLGIALHNELLLSAAFHAARFVLVPSLHPDWTLLLFFFHTHGTVTATLALVLVPKFRKLGAPPREEIVDEVDEEELDLQHSGSYFDSSTASAWSERSLDPSDIRDELKKLYAQLEVQKTKEMAVNNPHLPKRGSTRQGLGRSLLRYLAEFPEALTRQQSRDSGSPSRGSLPGSSRRRLLSSSLQEPKGSPALRKSRSTYDPHKDQDPPLLNSLLRRKLAKKASRAESRESPEGPPILGFRSASAHNLTVGERLPQARPITLHKSLSVATDSRDKALLLASQACLEETYRQAKEREERKKTEAAMGSPGQRLSTRRLAQAWGAALSAPPSPAKSNSQGSSHASKQLQEEAGSQLPRSPIRHQVSTPILTLSRAWVGESRMLSPTTTLAPGLKPAPLLTPVPTPPQSPSLLSYICPWEHAELPARKENVTPASLSGPERGVSSSVPTRPRIWRALSVAIEKRGSGENAMDTEDGDPQREAEDTDEDRPKIGKSHSLRAPAQQGSVRSLGLAIKALTRSRSTYREKESRGESPETGEEGRVTGEGVGVSPRSPRVGRSKAVSKQATLGPCNDESLQNQQNAHTSRMLHVCHQEGGREQDRGCRPSQGLGEGGAERAGKAGPTTLRPGRQGMVGDRNAERVKAAPEGCWERLPPAGLQSPGSAHRVSEVCPWEVTRSEVYPPDRSCRAEICPWEVGDGNPEGSTLGENLKDSTPEERRAGEKPKPKDGAASGRKKPERLVRGQVAICPWEGTDLEGLSTLPAPQDTELAEGRVDGVAVGQWGAAGPTHTAKAELCPWEAHERGECGKPAQQAMQENTPQKASFQKEQKLGGDCESLCLWESTDFRGPSGDSTQASRTPECPGSLGRGLLTEECPGEAGDAPALRTAGLCSRELEAEVPGEAAASKGTGGACKGGAGEAQGHAAQTLQPWSQQGPACPGERTVFRHASPRVDKASPKAEGQLSITRGSQVAQVCPWEDSKLEGTGATPDKAEICPWEANNSTAEDRPPGQAPKGAGPRKDQELRAGPPGLKDADVPAWEEQEGQIPEQEAVRSQEKVGPGSLPPQPGSQDTDTPQASFDSPGSGGNRTVEICPWDAEETLTVEEKGLGPQRLRAGAAQGRAKDARATGKFPKDTEEASGGAESRGSTVMAPVKPEGPAGGQEAACLRDSLDAGDSSHAQDTGRAKVGSQDPENVGVTSTEVYSQEAEKAEVCPWEGNEGATEKGLEQDTRRESAGSREKTLEKGRPTSQGRDLSKRTSTQSQEREAVCPWENLDWGAPSAPASSLPSNVAKELSWGGSDEKAAAGRLGRAPVRGSLPECMLTGEHAAGLNAGLSTEGGGTANWVLQSVCPREGVAPGGFLSHPDTERTGRWMGGRGVEVCPWDAPHPNAERPGSRVQAEICPWEGLEQIPEKGVSRPDEKWEFQEEKGKAPEKLEPQGGPAQKEPKVEGRQEVFCALESPDGGGPSSQAAPQVSVRSQSSLEAVGCVGARVDVCPWEAEEAPSARRAEICPWETDRAAAEEGGPEEEVDRDKGQGAMLLPQAGSRGAGGLSTQPCREQETVCSGESTDSEGLSLQPGALDTDQPTASPHEASSLGSRIAEVCRWEVTDPEGNKIKGTMADICPWEGAGVPSEEPGLLALTATQRDMFLPTAHENSPCLSVQRHLGGSLPDSKSPRPALIPEGVGKCQGPSELGPETSLAPEPSLPEAVAQRHSNLSEDQAAAISTTQDKELTLPNVCPWDRE